MKISNNFLTSFFIRTFLQPLLQLKQLPKEVSRLTTQQAVIFYFK